MLQKLDGVQTYMVEVLVVDGLKQNQVLHINILELMAFKFALQSLCQNFRYIHICTRPDNSAAVLYINDQGGSVISLFEEAKRIWL